MSSPQDGKTALDLGQDGDDVKEALLSHRFSGEVGSRAKGGAKPFHVALISPFSPSAQELEDEFLQDRLPSLVDRVTVSYVTTKC